MQNFRHRNIFIYLFPTGDETWPSGCCLRYVQGDKMGAADFVLVGNLMPKENGDISVNMRSPSTPGIYQGQWRMHTSHGVPFGGQNEASSYFLNFWFQNIKK